MAIKPNEYQAESLKTYAGAGSTPEAQLGFGGALAAGEAGELLNIANKVHWQGHPLDEWRRLHVLEEAGDVMWGLSVALDAAGWTFEDAMLFNRVKLAIRYHNAQFSTEDSINRIDVKDLPHLFKIMREFQRADLSLAEIADAIAEHRAALVAHVKPTPAPRRFATVARGSNRKGSEREAV